MTEANGIQTAYWSAFKEMQTAQGFLHGVNSALLERILMSADGEGNIPADTIDNCIDTFLGVTAAQRAFANDVIIEFPKTNGETNDNKR